MRWEGECGGELDWNPNSPGRLFFESSDVSTLPEANYITLAMRYK